MRRSAELVEGWRARPRPAAIARPVDAEGLGPRPVDDVLLIDGSGTAAGSLLGGTAHDRAMAAGRQLLDGDAPPFMLLGLDIADDDATAAGLTCGGHVDVLVQRLDDIPGELWDAIADGQPAVLVSRLDEHGGTLVVRPGEATAGSLGDPDLDALAEAEAAPLLSRPGTSTRRVRVAEVDLLLEGWNAAPRVVIVGQGSLAGALIRQAELLGWEARTRVLADEATAAIEALTTADIVVVLDHDPRVATPALAAALRRGVGYVGALGSRRTQAARRRSLEAAGLTSVELDRLHGPTGLDLGARTAAETAVSIVAEVLAVRSGRAAEPLRATDGRISG